MGQLENIINCNGVNKLFKLAFGLATAENNHRLTKVYS